MQPTLAAVILTCSNGRITQVHRHFLLSLVLLPRGMNWQMEKMVRATTAPNAWAHACIVETDLLVNFKVFYMMYGG